MAETENKIIQKDKKRMVKALFSYNPINVDELSLKINDILEVVEETEEGWWKGVLNGNVGMFPSNFVVELDNVPEELNNQTANELSPTKHPTKSKNVDSQETKHDSIHIPSSRRDIKTANSCSSGEDKTDTQKIAESIDKKGSLSKKNAVDSTAPRLPPKPVREQARVIYPYDALNEDELSLKEGDIITVISKEVEDKGWWKGELNNKTGVFPDNFVQLIKVEEQKKPERPDKPSTVFTSRASLRSDKSASEFSPKVDKKVIKTPPAKPPPPEIHKKETDRPVPPFPVKKPQVPHPMKKPSRSSLGPKFTGFSPPALITAAKPSAPENLLSFSTAAPVTETKPDLSKNAEKPSEKDDKKENQSKKESQGKKENQDLGFEGLESSGKKLVHLTANRAKAPNRRPPSHIFLRETEKENGLSSDPRRLSEPLLSEMKSLLHLGENDLHKVNLSGANEAKTAKVPPSRPLPPSIKGNKPAIQGSVILTKTISSEECIVKAPEPIKKAVLPEVSNIKGPEILPPQKQPILQPQKQPILQPQKQPILQPQKQAIPQPDKSKTEPSSSDKELQEAKESLKTLTSTMVSRSEFNELLKQVRELKESLENCSNNCKKTISELRNELEIEKKKRKALETELQHIKEHQTT